MCGICGVIAIDGGEVPIGASRLDAMTDSMTHRGPDDRGTFVAPGVAIGVRRLSIVDVAGGHQPFANEDGTVVAAQNGELYNHASIHARLERDGHRLRSVCDTEILPHLYERDGDRYPEALHGKFATVVWDSRRRRAVLARDRLGVKPLYWAQVGGCVVFGSELKAVLESGLVPRGLDVAALDLYFTLGYVPGPRTPFLHVRKLPPGSRLVVGGGRALVERYWNYPVPSPTRPAKDVHEYAEELVDLLRAAVSDRLMSDVPLGAMLSGGLDSSLVVALMAEASGTPVKTFSIGFRDDPSNELADARRIATTFDCEHHEIELTLADTPVELGDIAWHLDEPIGDLSVIGFDLLSKLAAESVTVALSGQGADELFGGYDKHRAAAMVDRAAFLPSAILRPLAQVGRHSSRIGRATAALAAGDPAERLLAFSGRMDAAERRALYAGPLADVPPDLAYDAISARLGDAHGDALSMTLYLDAQLALVDHMLLYFDKIAMAHSLEVRVPFLDHRLVEWAATLPSNAKVSGRLSKVVVKLAGEALLPPRNVHKEKVGFFRGALVGWLAAQLRGTLGDRLTSGSMTCGGLVTPERVRQLVAEFRRSPTEATARTLFAVVMLDAWLERFG